MFRKITSFVVAVSVLLLQFADCQAMSADQLPAIPRRMNLRIILFRFIQ